MVLFTLPFQIALVGQEPVLYARSIAENIGYGLDDCSAERIEAAAKQANAHEFITEMKEKYETQAGEKGTQLSGQNRKIIEQNYFSLKTSIAVTILFSREE